MTEDLRLALENLATRVAFDINSGCWIVEPADVDGFIARALFNVFSVAFATGTARDDYPCEMTFNCVNDFVYSPDTTFEEMQGLCLGLVTEIEKLRRVRSIL
jgi:hypothetical protein